MVEDFPSTALVFEDGFPTGEACWVYLLHLPWPKDFGCPQSGHGQPRPAGRGLLKCRAYQAYVSVMDALPFREHGGP